MINYDNILSNKVKDIPYSGIRKFFSLAEEMDDVISLGVGEPDFLTPWTIRQEAIHSLQRGKTWYSANTGLLKLREEISRYMQRRFELSYNPSDICVTVGGSEAIDLCIRAVIQDGDEVLIPEPCFVCYSPIVQFQGGVPILIPTNSENKFRLTASELKQNITDKTKLLILPFPNNPTGAVMRKKDLEELADVLKDTNILVMSDEIYGELTYGEKHISIASISDDMFARTVVVSGFSKSYAMTGWRLGYACGPTPIIEQMTKIHQYAIMCAPTTSQYAAITALKSCDEQVEQMRDEYDTRRKFLVDELIKIGLPCSCPEGAFYVFPCIESTGLTSEEFCEQLLYAEKVAVVPGTAFGPSGEGYVRISYSYSIAHLSEALTRMKRFISDKS